MVSPGVCLDHAAFTRTAPVQGFASARPQLAPKSPVVISEPILNETTEVLREKFERDPYTINDIRQKMEKLGNRVTPAQTLEVIKEDPDDDRILECAVAAKSDYIVTEDRICCGSGSMRGPKS